MEKIELPSQDDLNKIREEYKAPTVITPVAENKVETPKAQAATQQEPEAKVEVVVSEEKKQVNLDDLSEDQILELANKKGLKVSRETLTPEQQKKQVEIDEAEKRTFAINNLNMTNEQYDEIKNIIAADGVELTKKEFIKSYKTENKNATQEEINAAYRDYYNLPQSVKVKEIQKKQNPDTLEDEDIEVEVEKPKFEQKLSEWGELRIKTKAERIKANAKSVLDNIDTTYSNYKAFLAKANNYSKTADKVLSEIDFNALPVTYKFGEKGKEREIKAVVKLNDEAKADVINHLNGEIAQSLIKSDKHTDKEEISKQINRYIKEKYDNQVGESLWNLGHTSGLNEGKTGASAPFESTGGAGEVASLGALEKSVEERLSKEDDIVINKSRKFNSQ